MSSCPATTTWDMYTSVPKLKTILACKGKHLHLVEIVLSRRFQSEILVLGAAYHGSRHCHVCICVRLGVHRAVLDEPVGFVDRCKNLGMGAMGRIERGTIIQNQIWSCQFQNRLPWPVEPLSLVSVAPEIPEAITYSLVVRRHDGYKVLVPQVSFFSRGLGAT